jgi:hypothetical protein
VPRRGTAAVRAWRSPPGCNSFAEPGHEYLEPGLGVVGLAYVVLGGDGVGAEEYAVEAHALQGGFGQGPDELWLRLRSRPPGQSTSMATESASSCMVLTPALSRTIDPVRAVRGPGHPGCSRRRAGCSPRAGSRTLPSGMECFCSSALPVRCRRHASGCAPGHCPDVAAGQLALAVQQRQSRRMVEAVTLRLNHP